MIRASCLAPAASPQSAPAHALHSHSLLHMRAAAGAARPAATQPSTPLTCSCVRTGPGCCGLHAEGMLRLGRADRATRRPQVRAESGHCLCLWPCGGGVRAVACGAQDGALRLPCGRGRPAERLVDCPRSPASSSGAELLGYGRRTAARWANLYACIVCVVSPQLTLAVCGESGRGHKRAFPVLRMQY